MKRNITILFLLVFSNLFPQNTASFFVIDSLSKQAVPFLKIYIAGKDKGTYSDENGFVKINDLLSSDTLFFVDIFYEHKFLPLETLQKNAQILLSPRPFILNEAIIKPLKGREKEIEIGYSKIRPNTNYFNSIIGSELAFLIEHKNFKPAYIKDIIIKVKKNAKNNSMVKIHLYHNDHGKPGEEIYLKDNLYTLSYKDQIKYNIKSQNIQLPENGVFVSVEWIGKFNVNEKILNDNSYILCPRINIRSTSNKEIKGRGFIRHYGNWNPFLIKSYNGVEEFYIPLYGLIIVEQQ
jgi:hypothetical protein